MTKPSKLAGVYKVLNISQISGLIGPHAPQKVPTLPAPSWGCWFKCTKTNNCDVLRDLVPFIQFKIVKNTYR